jgi:hypothetical protein
MREQYKKIKQKYPERVVLLPWGNDQYITFDEDAQVLNKVLGIEIYETVDDDFNIEHNTFFSAERLLKFEDMLLKEGHKLAICDSLDATDEQTTAEEEIVEAEEEKGTTIGEFVYNEHGVCVKGAIETVNIQEKKVKLIVKVAQANKAWVHGVWTETPTSGMSCGCFLDSAYQYKSSEEATTASLYSALHWFSTAFNDSLVGIDVKKSIGAVIAQIHAHLYRLNAKEIPTTIDGKKEQYNQDQAHETPPIQPKQNNIIQLQLL